MTNPRPVTLIPGDGVGPELIRSTVRIIEAAGVKLAWEELPAGESVFRMGDTSGVPRETRDSIERTGVVLKGPLTTPVGFGEKSANVTLRKLFETYANLRPTRELPGVPTRYSGEGIDFVVVRENIEDLYAGIEHMQTPDVAQCVKLISRKGSEKVIRFAFELARREGRTKVTCATKANIMKLSEGLFKHTFEALASDYPEIQVEHLIIDNVAHQFVKNPAQFDIVVTTNLNGDIVSDLASALVGGLGFAPSGNYGDHVSIFETVHGSAPKYAGKDVINPTALILSSVLMLRHIGETDAADRVEDAVCVTLEDGKSITQDLLRQMGRDPSKAAGTIAFTDAVIENLGRRPATLQPRRVGHRGPDVPVPMPRWSYAPEHYAAITRKTVGFDLFVETDVAPDVLGRDLAALAGDELTLQMIASRGTKVYPQSGFMPDHVRHFWARFLAKDGGEVDDASMLAAIGRIAARYPQWNHVEKLREFDGERGYTLAQGQ